MICQPFDCGGRSQHPGFAKVATTAIFGRRLMENGVKELFERYGKLFRMALTDQVDMDKVASSYAAAFVAASPAGVSVGRNDEHLKQVMQQGFENYRRIGTKDMRLRNVRITPID